MNEMRINRFSEEGVMKRGLTVVFAALVLLTGCELRYRAISKLDITDAESLYLAPELPMPRVFIWRRRRKRGARVT